MFRRPESKNLIDLIQDGGDFHHNETMFKKLNQPGSPNFMALESYLQENKYNLERINATDSSRLTALDYFCSYGYTNAVMLLLKIPGINIYGIDNLNRSALIYAASFGRSECVKALLPMISDLNHLLLKDDEGKSALDRARFNKWSEIITLVENRILQLENLQNSFEEKKSEPHSNLNSNVIINNSLNNNNVVNNNLIINKLNRDSVTYQNQFNVISSKLRRVIILPEHLSCYLTNVIMNNPITISANGETCERQALAKLFADKNNPSEITCPKTGATIKITELQNATNKAIYNLINSFLLEQENTVEEEYKNIAVIDNPPAYKTTVTASNEAKQEKSTSNSEKLQLIQKLTNELMQSHSNVNSQPQSNVNNRNVLSANIEESKSPNWLSGSGEYYPI